MTTTVANAYARPPIELRLKLQLPSFPPSTPTIFLIGLPIRAMHIVSSRPVHISPVGSLHFDAEWLP